LVNGSLYALTGPAIRPFNLRRGGAIRPDRGHLGYETVKSPRAKSQKKLSAPRSLETDTASGNSGASPARTGRFSERCRPSRSIAHPHHGGTLLPKTD